MIGLKISIISDKSFNLGRVIMKKEYLIFLFTGAFLLLFNACAITNKVKVIKQIEYEINQMPLIKFLIRYDSFTEKFNLIEYTKEDASYIDESFGYYYEFLYTDMEGNIRKYIYKDHSEDQTVDIICYYNKDGSLCNIICDYFGAVSERYKAFEVSERGNLYVGGNKVVGGGLRLSYQLDSDGDFYTKEIKYTKYPEKIGDIDISKHIQADALKKQIAESILFSKEESLLFDFKGELEGKFTLINISDAKIRVLPDNNSEILKNFNYRHSVKVIEKIKKENSKETYWYKIIDTITEEEGYILGTYLEPIEQRIK